MPIIRIDSTPSTNLYLKELLESDTLSEGAVVVTDDQTAGRGQAGTHWESEPNKNLTFSLLLCPDFLPIHSHFLLSKVVALGIADSLREHTGDGLSIKWPNDIYYKDKKLVGILIENKITGSVISHSVIGIGVNVNQTRFVSDAPNPVSLRNITGQEFSVEELLLETLRAIELRYRLLKSGDYDKIGHDYFASLYRKDGYHTFCDKNGRFQAAVEAVDNSGYIFLLAETGETRKYAFKEVSFVQDSQKPRQ